MRAKVKQEPQQAHDRQDANERCGPAQGMAEFQQPSAQKNEPKVNQRAIHLISNFSTTSPDVSVRAKNTSSREASWWRVARWRIWSNVPIAIIFPRCKIMTRSHKASTKTSKCDDNRKAVPLAARRRMDSLMLRIPRGSRPVSGSSRM